MKNGRKINDAELSERCVRVYGGTDVGRIRQQNEDFLHHSTELNLYVVADGMGGHNAGDVASRVAVETVFEYFTNALDNLDGDMSSQDEYLPEILGAALAKSNLEVFDRSQEDPTLEGMGTTIVAAAVGENQIVLGHVGDSRIYEYHDGRLDRVTRDHSLLNLYLQNCWITEKQARYFPHKHIVLRAIGLHEEVDFEISVIPRREGAMLVLCSDGLTDLISDEDLAVILDRYGASKLPDQVEELIDAALSAGGHDNVTVMLVVV
jgi:protein phosphatase